MLSLFGNCDRRSALNHRPGGHELLPGLLDHLALPLRPRAPARSRRRRRPPARRRERPPCRESSLATLGRRGATGRRAGAAAAGAFAARPARAAGRLGSGGARRGLAARRRRRRPRRCHVLERARSGSRPAADPSRPPRRSPCAATGPATAAARIFAPQLLDVRRLRRPHWHARSASNAAAMPCDQGLRWHQCPHGIPPFVRRALAIRISNSSAPSATGHHSKKQQQPRPLERGGAAAPARRCAPTVAPSPARASRTT